MPITNSEESFLLRVATVEAMVTHRMTNMLFRPLFPWSNPLDTQSNAIEDLLDEIGNESLRREALLRSIITMTETKNSKARKKAAIKSVVKDIAKICTPMLDMNANS